MNGGADVVLSGVVKAFSMPGGEVVDVLRGVSLEVAAGDTLAVMGPSGSGKTTLLQIIGAMDWPDAGEVRVNGREIGGLDAEARAVFRNREVGFVFQMHHLLPQLTAFENVLVPAWTGRVNEACAERAKQLLVRVGLQERMNHFPGQLSGGERQRVALARALVMAPRLLLADEPTGALDHTHAFALMELLLELNAEMHTTLIVVTHAEDCAQRMKRRMQLIDGKLEAVNVEYK